MDIAAEVEEVKKELMDLIIAHLESNQLEPAKAQQLARDFLAVLPIASQQDLLAKLKTLGDEYNEVKTVYVKEYGKVQETKEEVALNQMRDAIKVGNIEDALATAKALQGGQQ